MKILLAILAIIIISLIILGINHEKPCKRYKLVNKFQPNLQVQESTDGSLDEIVDDGKWVQEKVCAEYK